MPDTAPVRAFHVMAKPVGPICNLDCKYCFYLGKRELYPADEQWKMPDDVLESFIRQHIQQQDVPQITFGWQGGEPTLMGVDFFRRAVELQAKYADGKQITNAMQTNGTLLDDVWCQFLTEHEFLVGVSLDGPPELHDCYRLDKGHKPTAAMVLRGIDLLKKHGAQFNLLTVVHRKNADKPLAVYEFLRQIGSGFIQFIPLVERLNFAEPLTAPPDPLLDELVTPESVLPEQFGRFLIAIFQQWVRRDVGQTFVQMFDETLARWLGAEASLCVFARTCGSAVALEHNGDVYSCDHYVYPRYRLGNLMNTPLADMVYSDQQRKFGRDKADALPQYCQACPVQFACNGGCPKHRLAITPAPNRQPGLNYLCAGYKAFFTHVEPYIKIMAQLICQGQAPVEIMPMLAPPQKPRRTAHAAPDKPGRNAPCPCGSGKKFKQCCGRNG